VKTTVEISDRLLREAKSAAATRGLSLKTFLNEALREKLSRRQQQNKQPGWPVPPPEVAKGEIKRIQSAIDHEFSGVNAEEWK
jgi:hypothetical protein